MIVTKIERQKHHPLRINLFLDDEFAFGLHEEILFNARIRVGDSLDPTTIELLKSHEEYKLAKDKALRLVSYRLRSKKELRMYLLEKEFDPAVVDNVLLELQTTGIVNDRKFAAAFIHDSLLRKPTGKNMLFHKLRLKGIDRAIIEEILSETLPAEEEHAMAYTTAMNILKRYQTSRKSIPPEQQQQRVAQYLVRRGFNWNTITPVLKKMFQSKNEIF